MIQITKRIRSWQNDIHRGLTSRLIILKQIVALYNIIFHLSYQDCNMKTAFILLMFAAFIVVSHQSKADEEEVTAIRSLLDSLSKRLEVHGSGDDFEEANRLLLRGYKGPSRTTDDSKTDNRNHDIDNRNKYKDNREQ